jgi:hypothetical protein
MLGGWEESSQGEYARKFSTEQRRELAKKGWALSDGSYPIETEADIGPAITLAASGHGDVAAAKALIKRRAKELGASNRIPSTWAAAEAPMKTCPMCGGSGKVADAMMGGGY